VLALSACSLLALPCSDTAQVTLLQHKAGTGWKCVVCVAAAVLIVLQSDYSAPLGQHVLLKPVSHWLQPAWRDSNTSGALLLPVCSVDRYAYTHNCLIVQNSMSAATTTEEQAHLQLCGRTTCSICCTVHLLLALMRSNICATSETGWHVA
jgi:hypothetical protein